MNTAEWEQRGTCPIGRENACERFFVLFFFLVLFCFPPEFVRLCARLRVGGSTGSRRAVARLRRSSGVQFFARRRGGWFETPRGEVLGHFRRLEHDQALVRADRYRKSRHVAEWYRLVALRLLPAADFWRYHHPGWGGRWISLCMRQVFQIGYPVQRRPRHIPGDETVAARKTRARMSLSASCRDSTMS